MDSPLLRFCPFVAFITSFTARRILCIHIQIYKCIHTFQDTLFGCCTDGQTPAAGPDGEGCPIVFGCEATAFGCCSDGVTPANGFNGEGCKEKDKSKPCEETPFGCCYDGIRPAKGVETFTFFELSCINFQKEIIRLVTHETDFALLSWIKLLLLCEQNHQVSAF